MYGFVLSFTAIFQPDKKPIPVIPINMFDCRIPWNLVVLLPKSWQVNLIVHTMYEERVFQLVSYTGVEGNSKSQCDNFFFPVELEINKNDCCFRKGNTSILTELGV